MSALSSLTQPRCPDRLTAQLRQLLVHAVRGERLYHHVAPAEQLSDPSNCRITLLALAKTTPHAPTVDEALRDVRTTSDIQNAARHILAAYDTVWLAKLEYYHQEGL